MHYQLEKKCDIVVLCYQNIIEIAKQLGKYHECMMNSYSLGKYLMSTDQKPIERVIDVH